jgi:hypothetical protein
MQLKAGKCLKTKEWISGLKLQRDNRRPGCHDAVLLVTVCAGCHACIHHLRTNRRWLPSPLFELWCEQHPDSSIQLQLAWEAAA